MHLKNAHQEEETGSDDYELWGMGGTTASVACYRGGKNLDYGVFLSMGGDLVNFFRLSSC